MAANQTAAEFAAELSGMAGRAPDFAPALKAAIPIVRADERQHFDAKESPDGVPWATNAPLTVARKGHGDILVESGALEAASVGDAPGHVEQIEGNQLTYGVDGTTDAGGVPWAAVQQAGNDKIPARPFMGMSEAAIDKAAEVAADEEMKKWL